MTMAIIQPISLPMHPSLQEFVISETCKATLMNAQERSMANPCVRLFNPLLDAAFMFLNAYAETREGTHDLEGTEKAVKTFCQIASKHSLSDARIELETVLNKIARLHPSFSLLISNLYGFHLDFTAKLTFTADSHYTDLYSVLKQHHPKLLEERCHFSSKKEAAPVAASSSSSHAKSDQKDMKSNKS